MKRISHKSIRAIGEAMVEMAPVADGLYRRGFAGDTYNTAWHMAQWLGSEASVGILTCVGKDGLSDDFLKGMANDGMDVSAVSRDPYRNMGLYMIELNGVERSFHYWRDTSAARHLADDADRLVRAHDQVGLTHLSGITLAILNPRARETLFDVLATFRAGGGVVSFDPNIRPRLWSSQQEMRETLTRALSVSDIALPSLDDERLQFGDRDPDATISRMTDAGVHEVVVKNGPDPVVHFADGTTISLPTPAVPDIIDTTGAGDAFNAGYLCARVMSRDAEDCVRAGQAMAAVVLSHHGALASKAAVSALPALKPSSRGLTAS
jgi:2-dehydro-3-deoxygluconokinase